jgi:periplasmic divalent cation tolerance protein
MKEEYIQVFTTTAKKEDAENVVKSLLEKRLAGCIQILGPIKSTYWWKGKIDTTEEWLCIIKTKKSVYQELEKSIKEIHPYEVPEIIATSVVAGNGDYLKWLSDEVSKR